MSGDIEAFGCAMSLSKRVFNRDKNGKVAPNFPKSAKTVLSHSDHYGGQNSSSSFVFCSPIHRPCRSIEKGSSQLSHSSKSENAWEKHRPGFLPKKKDDGKKPNCFKENLHFKINVDIR